MYSKEIHGVVLSCLCCIDALSVVWICQGYSIWVNVSLLHIVDIVESSVDPRQVKY